MANEKMAAERAELLYFSRLAEETAALLPKDSRRGRYWRKQAVRYAKRAGDA